MNAFENIDLITQESLMHFVNECSVFKTVRHEWDEKFAQDGAKVGDSLRIRKALNATIRTGASVDLQDLDDDYVTLTLQAQIGSDFSYSSREKTLSLDRISERYLLPRMRRIANEVDRLICEAMAQQATNFVGAPGTIPTALTTYQDAQTRLLNLGVPKGPLKVITTPNGNQNVVNDLRGLIEAGPRIARQYDTGRMKRAVGMDWDMDQNLYRHTVGALGSVPLVTTAGQTGASILADGAGGAVTNYLLLGDKITFAGVNAVNRITGESTGQLRQFTVTANVTSAGGGTFTIPIDPPITTSGPDQTVTAAPAENAIILVWGHASSYAAVEFPTQLVFHPESCAVALVGLERPEAGEKSSYKVDEDAGISIRFVKQYEARTDLTICRFDCLFGIVVQIPDWICVVAS